MKALKQEEPKGWEGLLNPDWIKEMDATPFLSRCRSGQVTIAELKEYLVQQYFYSRHFTRYLCALLSNMSDEEDRQALTENLVDEAGLGEVKGIPHSRIYRSMLDSFGLEPKVSKPLPETESLVKLMLLSCRDSDGAVGLGALCIGAEAIVPHLYGQIVKGFEANGFTKEQLHFFYLHMECDDEHSATMQKIILNRFADEVSLTKLGTSAQNLIKARTLFFEALSV